MRVAEVPSVALGGIVKSWGRPRRRVLDGIDLHVAPGEAVQIGGRNGAGKTTLLRIVAGMIVPDAGTIRVLRMDPERDRRELQAAVGWLPAGDRGLYARLTPRQHLALWSRLAMLPRGLRAGHIERAIDRFALEEIADRRVDRLSMGQRQRARLAMTFLHEPALVLLDEPRNSLDEDGIELLAGAAREVTARGGTVLCCTPGAEPAGVEPDRRLVIEDGGLRDA